MNQPTNQLKLGQVDSVNLQSDPMKPTSPKTPQQQKQPAEKAGQQQQQQSARLDNMFATLDRNLTKRVMDEGTQTRTMIDDELDGIARAINGLEGTIRIDMRPEIEAAVVDALDARGMHKSRPVRRFIGGLLLLASGVAIGVFGESQIREAYSVIEALISGYLS